MSKSLGNFFTVRDLLAQGVPGEVIRFVFLMTHYRKPMDWTASIAKEAEQHLRRWRAITKGFMPTKPDPEVESALADDMNTSQAIHHLHILAGGLMTFRSYRVALENGYIGPDISEAAGIFLASANLLGLLTDDCGAWEQNSPNLDNLGQMLTTLRIDALAKNDFSAVDALKSALVAAGVEVQMSKLGVELYPGPNFDPAKLDALK